MSPSPSVSPSPRTAPTTPPAPRAGAGEPFAPARAERPPLPPVPAPYRLPFHYGALHIVGLDYLVAPGPVRDLLAEHHPDLAAADFDGRACVSLNYQLYFAQYPTGGGITQEVEVNIVAHPAAAAGRPAAIGYGEYARGVDQTKLLGIARIHVLCDNALAIDAGRRLYAEPKYPGRFESVMPSPNGPAGGTAWSVVARQAALGGDGTVGPAGRALFSFSADLAGLTPEPVHSAPVTGYGTDPVAGLLAGPMNVHQPYQYHELDDSTASRVTLAVADRAGGVGRDLATLVGDAPAAGVWTYQSAPVAAHHRAYYVPSKA
ncbi:hypothetical protein GCM10010495_31860 [Kitasatospora herbaricolor]|uniref:hypothetical protein n=1 Tax=Kitasatospora herbaricolor TaxID=68217 RepID=UPI0019880750|nr:hypothetical protein [Kitasatospora herbaricolor]MDQ0312369.1 hypothetical protein [Kitasatospora herbaricolor]GGV15324.1 hypothetical protein GCM10010495_31860 [Kitasatospora herbaricolor]